MTAQSIQVTRNPRMIPPRTQQQSFVPGYVADGLRKQLTRARRENARLLVLLQAACAVLLGMALVIIGLI